MNLTKADTKFTGLVNDLFLAPENLLTSYFLDKKIPYKTVMKLHLLMWLIAPVSKIIHNIAGNFIHLVTTGSFSGNIMEGTFKTILIYPAVYFLVWQLDKIRYIYVYRTDKKKETYNPQKILVLTFLPFSSSAVFWILPAPFNFFLIIGSFVYSLMVSRLALEKFCKFDRERMIHLGLVLAIFVMTVVVVIVFILNILRTVIN